MPLPGELLPGEGYVPSAGPLYQNHGCLHTLGMYLVRR